MVYKVLCSQHKVAHHSLCQGQTTVTLTSKGARITRGTHVLQQLKHSLLGVPFQSACPSARLQAEIITEFN